MSEKELIIKANEYIKKLANGINPLNNEILDQNDIVNNVNVTRCLYFVSNILEKYLSGETLKHKNSKKVSYYAKKSDLDNFDYDNSAMCLTNIVSKINDITKKDGMKKLKYKEVSEWLINKGLLSLNISSDGKSRTIPTEIGNKLGISIDYRESSRGNYYVNIYNINAQKYIVENTEEIINYINS